ncbi:MAG: Z1 domain-containing protein, partial [Isosphaeraceae bacterium]
MRETDESYNTFRELTDHYPPHVAVQKLKAFRVPSDVIAAIVQRHEAEATKILTLKEPPASGRENAQKWYTGPQPHDKNWPAYEKRLLDRLSAEAVTVLHDASDKVVAMLDHPATDTFRSRGLVLGHVQSGKTSNFTAVIGKAADRGYRMFIVLSGVHNALRSQTQNRLISDLVDLNPTLWHQIT